MTEQLDNSEGVETLDRNAHNPMVGSEVPAGSLWANAIGTSETPKKGTIVAGDFVDDKVTHESPEVETLTRVASAATDARSSAALLDLEESGRLRTRWSEVQGQFVDAPRIAVQQADALVSEVIEQITRTLAKEHGALEGQWKRGDDVSTEDLRMALQHYRSLFNRLVV